ncbi:MAG: hypothetical protein Q4P13_12070 [Psychrobacter sp.]|nr:hypothetical protein [Psychrobacter sp.]
MVAPKLPKAVAIMVEKNNLVMAIKTLAEEQNISMEEAKAKIDAYELALKAKQQQKINHIASKQGIPSQALGIPPSITPVDDAKANPRPSPFKSLNTGLDNHLDDIGYKKPLLPYWMKRVVIILLVMAAVFWLLWRTFG